MLTDKDVSYSSSRFRDSTEFRFQRLHIPSGQVREGVVWVADGVKAILKLLKYWNSNPDWWYAPLI